MKAMENYMENYEKKCFGLLKIHPRQLIPS